MTTEAQTKPDRVLLETGPTLTVERVIAFTERIFDRPLTPAEIEEARTMLGEKIPAK